MAKEPYSKNILASRIGLTVFASCLMKHRAKDPDTLGPMLDAKTEPFCKTISANLFIISPKHINGIYHYLGEVDET